MRTYIAKYYNEITELLEVMPIAKACYEIANKYDLDKSPDNLRVSYQKYDDWLNTNEIKKQTFNKNGELINETFGKKQDTHNQNLDNFNAVSLTTNPFGSGAWVKYIKNLDYTPKQLKEQLDNRKAKKFKIKKRKGSKIGVSALTDFHLGAFVMDLLKTKDFNYTIVSKYLQEIAQIINEKNYKENHILMLGDFIESFTGLNHLNSWKGMHRNAYAMQGVIFAHEILSEHFYSKIENLKYICFISGNHDRTTSNKQEDASGEVAMMLQYLFNKDFKGVKSEWNDTLISKQIDGINYVATHGNLALNKKDISKILFDYGKQGMYNVFLQGHLHSAEQKRYYKQRKFKYKEIESVCLDSLDYQAITVRPLFTGNLYSEQLGFTSNAGFSHFVNNGKGQIIHTDFII